jgi:hypothetical protein
MLKIDVALTAIKKLNNYRKDSIEFIIFSKALDASVTTAEKDKVFSAILMTK